MNEKSKPTYHIILKIKSNKKLLDEEAFDFAKKSILLCTKAHRWNILELKLEKTYLDLLINLPNSISIDAAVNILKNENKTIPWGLGYFVETVDSFDLSSCKLCLKNKAKKNKIIVPL